MMRPPNCLRPQGQRSVVVVHGTGVRESGYSEMVGAVKRRIYLRHLFAAACPVEIAVNKQYFKERRLREDCRSIQIPNLITKGDSLRTKVWNEPE
jgi:hypothetical protein